MSVRIDRRSIPDFLEDVRSLLNTDGPPTYALLVGSGFSYPLIPTGGGMIRDIPWWLYWQSRRNDKTNGFPDRFGPRLPTGDSHERELLKFECDLWSALVTRQPELLHLKTDGTPDLQPPNAVTSAYTSLMSSSDPRGLNTPNRRRAYLRDVIGRVGREINQAHLFLAGILQTQDATEPDLAALWAGRRPFCRTIFTTNFDPLLQRSLQLVGKLYSLSDRPEVLDPPDDDDSDTMQLIYTHGSSHRYLLLNTREEIERAKNRNAAALTGYFERHGVIVIGYSGWQDTIMAALQQCTQFDGNLYWVDIHDSARCEDLLAPHVVDFLEQHRGNAFYVQAAADDLMAALHAALGLGPAPRCLVDPIGLVMDQLRKVQLSDQPFFEIKSSAKTSETSASNLGIAESVGADRLKTASSQRDFLRNTLVRLEGAKQFFDQPQLFAGANDGNAAPSAASETVVRTAVTAKLMSELTQAALQGDVRKAETLSDLILGSRDLTDEQQGVAYLSRGFSRIEQKRFQEAIDDLARGLECKTLSAELRSLAWLHRGSAFEAIGALDKAVEQYDHVIEMKDAPESYLAIAYVARGSRRIPSGQVDNAISDFTRAAELPGAFGATRARAIYNRGVAYLGRGEAVPAGKDFSSVASVEGVEDEIRALALNNSGIVKLRSGDIAGARENFEIVLTIQGATPEARELALTNRGLTFSQSNEHQRALSDYDEVLTSPQSTSRGKILASTNRIFSLTELRRYTEAIDEATSLIDTTGVDTDAVASSLLNRGRAKSLNNEPRAAIEDFDALLKLPNASDDLRTKAKFNRATALRALGENDAAAHDLQSVIEAPAPNPLLGSALLERTDILRGAKRFEEALADVTALIGLAGSGGAETPLGKIVRASVYVELGRTDEALDDCNAELSSNTLTAEQRATALHQRALVYERRSDSTAALADYAALIELPGAPSNKIAAGHFRSGLLRESSNVLDLALSEYTAAIAIPEADLEVLAAAHLRRGIVLRVRDELDPAAIDLSTVIDMTGGIAQSIRDSARFHHALIRVQRDELDQAISEFSILVEDPATESPTLAETLLWRGRCYTSKKDRPRAMEDYSRSIDIPGAPPSVRADALMYRSYCFVALNDDQREIADLTSVIEMPEAPPEVRARALMERGTTQFRRKEYPPAKKDFQNVDAVDGASPAIRAEAHFAVGTVLTAEGTLDSAINEFTIAIDAPGVDPATKSKALNNRAFLHSQNGNFAKAMADWTAVLAIPDTPMDQRIVALRNRADQYGSNSEWSNAIADYTAFLALPDITRDDRISVLVSRAWYGYESGDVARLIEDSSAALEIEPMQENSLFNLGLGYLLSGDEARTLKQYEHACQTAKSRDIIEASLKEVEQAVITHGPLACSGVVLAMMRRCLDNAATV